LCKGAKDSWENEAWKNLSWNKKEEENNCELLLLLESKTLTCLEVVVQGRKRFTRKRRKNVSMNQKKEIDTNLWTSSPTWIQKIAMLQLMRITTCRELVQGRAKDSWENGGNNCHEQKQEKRFVNFLLLLESTKSSPYASINSHNNLLELIQGREIFVSKWRKTYHEQTKRKNCVLSSPTWIHKTIAMLRLINITTCFSLCKGAKEYVRKWKFTCHTSSQYITQIFFPSTPPPHLKSPQNPPRWGWIWS